MPHPTSRPTSRFALVASVFALVASISVFIFSFNANTAAKEEYNRVAAHATEVSSRLFENRISGNLTKGVLLQYCAISCDSADFTEITVDGFTVVKYTPPFRGACAQIRRSGYIITAPSISVESRDMYPLNEPQIAYCGTWFFGAKFPEQPVRK